MHSNYAHLLYYNIKDKKSKGFAKTWAKKKCDPLKGGKKKASNSDLR